MYFFRRFRRPALLTGWWLVLLMAGFSPASDPPVVLSGLTRDYTGSPIIPAAATSPQGLPVALLYRELSSTAPGGDSETVFNSIPATLPLSFASLSFAAGVSGLGNYVRLGGGARELESCDVVMVNWARASQFPDWAALNPSGYEHPVTVTLFTVSPANSLTHLATVTRTITVPWRPDTLPNGQPWPFNGYAFTATFAFPPGTILTEQVMVMVNYDTQSTGFTPIGQSGPYNQLNVALDGTAPSTGADLDPDVVLRVTPEAWYYPNSGWSGFSGPMARLRASHRVTKTPPVIPGSYQVTAIVGSTGTEGIASGILTITAPTLSTWQESAFSPDQLADGTALPNADPDRDGLTNLVEYALGTSPQIPTGEPPWTLDPAGLIITLDRPRWLTGVTCVAEESSDMSEWVPRPLEVISRSLTRETVRATASADAAASPRRFLRIRFTE